MTKTIITLVLVALISACTKSHLEIFPELDDPALIDRELSVKQLHEDIDAFVQGIKLRHPNYDQYANATEIQRKVKELKSVINEPMTRVDFYRHIGQLSHLFNDGHSFLIWPYQELSMMRDKGDQVFPLDVTISKSGLALKHAYQLKGESKVLPRGAEIVSINGRDVSTLLETMQQYNGGETRMLRDHVVAMRFGISFWAVYGDINEYEVVLNAGEEQIQITLSKEQTWQRAEVDGNATDADFYFDELVTTQNDSVGYLYIGTFDVELDEFYEFIDDTFESIKKQNIASLIIDIRENGGGNTDSAQYLTQYIANKEFRMVSRLKERLNHENRGIFGYRGAAGEFIEEQWDELVSPTSSPNLFSGDTYLLISPLSYSSAIVFATTLKDHEFATLIGQETGGFANQTGQGNLFNLPHSKLRAYVPTRLLLRPSGDETVKGVVPDVIPKKDDTYLESGIDPDIQTALRILEQKFRRQ